MIGITGYSGFVGSNFIQFITNKYPGQKIKLINLREQFNLGVFDGISVLIHLAGKAHDTKGKTNFEEYHRINTALTIELYELFLQSKVETFIFMSSIKAVKDTVEKGVLSEEVIPTPKTDYGKSKLMAEDYIISKKDVSGKRYFILRPCMIYGPGNKGNLNLLYNFVKKRIPYPLSAFHNERSFLAVENLCFVIDQIIQKKDILSGIYHIADNKPISTCKVISLMGETLGFKPTMLSIPRFLIRCMANLGDFLYLPFNSHKLNKLTENYIVSNKKIVTAIGSSLPVETEAGLRRTLSSFKNAS